MQTRITVAPALTYKDEIYNESINRTSVIVLDRLQVNLVPCNKNITYSKDYLARTYSTRIEGKYKITDSIILALNRNGLPGFSYSLKVYCNDVLVGEMGITPYGRGIDTRLINFRLDNRLLYTENWLQYYDNVKQALDLEFRSFNYVEIAYDSHGKYPLIKHLIDNSTDKDIGAENHKYKKVTRTTAVPTERGYRVGSSTSSKLLLVYIKLRPGKETDKPHIDDLYKVIGMNTKQQIDRVEARLRNKFLHRYQLTEEDFTNPVVLEQLFADAVGNDLSYYVISSMYHDHHGNKKYSERIDLIDLTKLTGTSITKRIPIPVKEEVKIRRSFTITFKKLLTNYLREGRMEDLVYLRHYISQECNAIVPIAGHHISDDHDMNQALNREKYKALVNICIDDYDGIINGEVLERMETVVGKLFETKEDNTVVAQVTRKPIHVYPPIKDTWRVQREKVKSKVKTKTIRVRVDEIMYTQFKEICEKKESSYSSVIRNLIDKLLMSEV
ncbi:hypothetical protein [Pontibacter ruber]|uniref:Uncharacterized protein n=1 Tax=Pontibacter ruber TaxID=1343895 RepID=A0ABW5CXX7_9BACT|nr:hypothetical protein [Pontibacter ruber]